MSHSLSFSFFLITSLFPPIFLSPSPLFPLSLSLPGRVSLVRGTSLRVERLMVEDEGAYECQLFLLDHVTNVSRSANWTQLSVTGTVD